MKLTGVAIFLSVCIQTLGFLILDVNLPFLDQIISAIVPNVKQPETVTFGRAECKRCTDYIDNNMAIVKFVARSFNYTKLTEGKVPLCSNCQAKGIETISLYGDACLQQNSPDTSITKSNYQWEFVNASCDCQLPTNPTDLLKQLQQALSTCPDGTTTLTPPDLSQALKISNIVKCMSSPGIDIPKSQTVTIELDRVNPKVFITVKKNKNVKGPMSATVIAGGIIESDMAAINTTCYNHDKSGFNLCNCLTSNNVIEIILEQVVEVIAQCVEKSRETYLTNILDAYAVCSD